MAMPDGAAIGRGRVVPGWWVVRGAFGVTGMGFGSAYTFSVFIEPLQQAFGASRGQAALVFSIAGCLNFTLGLVSSPMADRYGARPMSRWAYWPPPWAGARRPIAAGAALNLAAACIALRLPRPGTAP